MPVRDFGPFPAVAFPLMKAMRRGATELADVAGHAEGFAVNYSAALT